jgi:hypothetical protein
MTATLALLCFVLSAGPPTVSAPNESVELREALAEFGREDPFFTRAEYWYGNGVILLVSKSPDNCDADTLKAAKIDPESWFFSLRVLFESLPADQKLRSRILGKRLFMLKQTPGGASCAWRLLAPVPGWSGGPDERNAWSSVTEMRRTTVKGSCEDALSAIAKLQVAPKIVDEIRTTLRSPGSLAECSKP